MKKIIALLLSFALILSIAGCNSQKNYTVPKTDNEDMSYTIGYDDQTGFTSRSAMNVSNGKGSFSFRVDQMIYTDYMSGLSTVVCSKPDCKHIDENCGGYFDTEYYYGKGYAFYDDSLWMLGESSTDSKSVSLYKISQDGITREEYCTLFSISDTNDIFVFTIHRGYAFWTISYDDKAILYSMNLEDKKVQTAFEQEGYFPYISSLIGCGNCIYLSTFYAFDKEWKDWSGKIAKLNIATNQCEVILDSYADFTVNKNGLFYYFDGKIHKLDLNTKEDTVISEIGENQWSILSDGEKLWLTNFTDDTVDPIDYQIIEMTCNGKIENTINIPEMEFFVGVDSNFLYIDTNEGDYKFCKKTNISSKKTEWSRITWFEESSNGGFRVVVNNGEQ